MSELEELVEKTIEYIKGMPNVLDIENDDEFEDEGLRLNFFLFSFFCRDKRRNI